MNFTDLSEMSEILDQLEYGKVTFLMDDFGERKFVVMTAETFEDIEQDADLIHIATSFLKLCNDINKILDDRGESTDFETEKWSTM